MNRKENWLTLQMHHFYVQPKMCTASHPNHTNLPDMDAVLFTCCLHFVLCLSQVAGAGAETAPEEALARVFF
jgi:hypothetical protein